MQLINGKQLGNLGRTGRVAAADARASVRATKPTRGSLLWASRASLPTSHKQVALGASLPGLGPRRRVEVHAKRPDASLDDSLDSVKRRMEDAIDKHLGESMHSVYGAAAAMEVERLQNIAESCTVEELEEMGADTGSIDVELAAAKLSLAAGHLASVERELTALRIISGKTGDASAIAATEGARRDAQQALETRWGMMAHALWCRLTQPPAQVDKSKPVADQSGQAQEEKQHRELTMGKGVRQPRVPPVTKQDPPEEVQCSACASGKELLLQAFNWESSKHSWWKTLLGQVDAIKADGFTGVWLPPCAQSLSEQGYMPTDLWNFNTRYGSEQELRELISKFHEKGVKVYADVVVNHRCANQQGPDGKWNTYTHGKMNWDQSAICSNNPQFGGRGNPKQGDEFGAAPNIDHTQDFVRRDIIEWLQHLRGMGFDGWRWDFVRGWPGGYCKEYIEHTDPYMTFGEYWDTCNYTDSMLDYDQDRHRLQTLNWCEATGGRASAFDFTTKAVLQDALRRNERWRLADPENRPPGTLGLWPSRAVTILDNHDTGSTQNHWPFPSNNIQEGYAYILTHPGTPCVFYDHLYPPYPSGQRTMDSLQAERTRRKARKPIIELIQLRERLGIHARSQVSILKADADLYAASVDGKLVVKLGPSEWAPGPEDLDGKQLKLAVSGHQFAVWEAEV